MSGGRWSGMDPLAAAATSSSDSEGEGEDEDEEQEAEKEKEHHPSASASSKEDGVAGQKRVPVSFETLSRHGYSGGPSVLYVPPPKSSQEGEQDWSWSSGKRKGEDQDDSESLENRDQTRDIVNEGAIQAASRAIAEYNYTKKQRREAAAEQRALSFSQKEKRKRDLGQASRGKSYVEEEKRLLRDQGIYSGFDT